MKHEEAERLAGIYNKRPGVVASVIRILSAELDPPVDGDNGWDVKICVQTWEGK